MTTSPQHITDRSVNPTRILCPIDLSDFSHPALASAVSLGAACGAHVSVLHVVPPPTPPVSTTGARRRTRHHVSNECGTNATELHERLMLYAGHAAATDVRVAEGDAATEIVRCARELSIDLIVIGTHGRNGFDRFALGSVAEKVLRKASCPVLTLPPAAHRQARDVVMGKILCPIDFSSSSKDALDYGISLAARVGGTVTAMHVVEALDGEPDDRGPDYIGEFRRRQCVAAAGALHDAIAKRGGTAVIKEVVVLGRPHREIVRAADEGRADLIVMGVCGRGPYDLALFGSTTNQVVRRARCPVVTVRSQQKED